MKTTTAQMKSKTLKQTTAGNFVLKSFRIAE